MPAAVGTLELLAAPLSLAIAGLVIETTSATTSLAIIGSGCLIATIYTATTPALRKIEADDLVPHLSTRLT